MTMNLETKCLHAGYRPKNGEPRNIPIVQSTTFRYETSQDMAALFDLEAAGYFYTRLQNPTSDHVAAKIAEMEGGSAALLLSSGRRHLSIRSSTLRPAATISSPRPPSTAAPTTCSP